MQILLGHGSASSTVARAAADDDERAPAATACRREGRRTATRAPHQLRHAHAVEMAREGVPLNVIQRQLGHANLAITSVYLQGIDNAEIIDTVHSRRAPMIPASAGLRQPR
ncbi:MAG TPA: site-specific integrase [Solirubrobacteraceae bacterium]|nr:site-specific integrase [Solirubrobacteraceae bacterium]